MNSENAMQVLLVEDDDDVRDALATGLRLSGFDIVKAANGHRALELMDNVRIGAIVSDIRMPMLDGRQLLQRVRAIDGELPVILITGHGDIQQAVDAVRSGAYDFLAKPFASDRLADTVARALEVRRLVLENRHLRATISATRERLPSPLIGTSAAISALMRVVEQIGNANIDILIEGEQGSGKRAVAELLHKAGSGHQSAARIHRCDIMTEQAINDAFTGEGAARGGRSKASRSAMTLSVSDGGTLILDNVGALSPSSQACLLHYLHQRNRDDSAPSSRTMEKPARIVSTSIGSLSDLVSLGLFRADLYFKLAPVKIEVPPLRARKQDIPALFAHLLFISAERFGRPVPIMSDAILAHLANHDWPGNLRELHNFAEQVVLNLEKAEYALAEENLNLAQRVALFEKEAIVSALRSMSGDMRKTCAKLGMPRKTLYDKIARYQIDLPNIRAGRQNSLEGAVRANAPARPPG